jgi:hypothetical protein
MRVAWVALAVGCGFQSSPAPSADPGDGPFDLALCPESYNATLPGPSRYRLISASGSASNQIDACDQDLPGATHLVILETMPEFTSVKGFVDGFADNAIAHNAVWIGGVQQRSALLPGQGWLGFDGAPLLVAWDPDTHEPNDGGGLEDRGEQFVFYEHNRKGLADVPGNMNSGALCECDGKPITASAMAAIDSNR